MVPMSDKQRKFQCTKCKHPFTFEGVPTSCPKCKSKYMKWLNYMEFAIDAEKEKEA